MQGLYYSLGILFCGSLILTIITTALCRMLAKKLHIVDYPDGYLKKHRTTTPYLGGVAIFLTFITLFPLFVANTGKDVHLLLGLSLLLLLGVIDDKWKISPISKLVGEVLAAFFFLQAGYLLFLFPTSPFLNKIVSIFWVVLIVNAMNLVDIMDGLATVLVIGSSLGLFFLAFMLQYWDLATLCLILLGALVGFLTYNRPPATIFLGDAGSLFLGGVVAVLPMMLISRGRLNLSEQFAVLCFQAVPIAEVCTLICIRTIKKIPFYRGSAHHYGLYLKRKGWSTEGVLRFSLLFSGIVTIGSLLFLLGGLSFAAFLFLLVFLFVLWCVCIFK